jgi:hypothetical protein
MFVFERDMRHVKAKIDTGRKKMEEKEDDEILVGKK